MSAAISHVDETVWYNLRCVDRSRYGAVKYPRVNIQTQILAYALCLAHPAALGKTRPPNTGSIQCQRL